MKRPTPSPRRLLAVLCLAAAASCGPNETPPPNQGTNGQPDAGARVDAGETDSGDVVDPSDDAGTQNPDAADDAGPGGDAGDGDAGGATGSIEGFAYSAETGKPLAGLRIAVAGQTVDTTADGAFTLSGVAAGRHVVAVGGTGIATTFETVEVLTNESSFLEAFAPAIDFELTFDASLGGDAFDGSSGARAMFGAGTLIDANGDAVSGDVTVSLASLDPGRPLELRAFPGEFSGVRDDQSEVAIETFGPMEITVMQGGEEVNIAPGQTAEIAFPIYDFDAPETIPLWSLDEATGRWVEEGIAVRSLDENGNDVYRSTITHMSWWNPDRPIERTCVRVCVTDQGAPVAGASITATGVGYGYEAREYSDTTGCASIRTRRNSPVSLRAGALAGVSESTVVVAPDTLEASNPADCENVGTLELGPRPADGCPGGLVDCAGTCVDLAADSENCGTCGDRCAYGQTCNGGECGCPFPQVLCGFECLDPNSDSYSCGGCGGTAGPTVDFQPPPVCYTGTDCCAEIGVPGCEETPGAWTCRELDTNSNCGSCGNVCPADQSCRLGACQPLNCQAGEVACENRCVTGTDCVGFCTWRGQCADDEDCIGNRCQQLTCPAGEVACDHQCFPGTQCGVPCDSGTACQAGSCEPLQCANGLTACGNRCTDTETDRSNCGGCGNYCRNGLECVAGACQAIGCPNGEVWCDGQCTATDSDARHCGGCAPFAGTPSTCVGAGCCAAGQEFGCPTGNPDEFECARFELDEDHCGGCGIACGDDEICRAGICEPLGCPAGQIGCNHRCVNGSTCGEDCGAGTCTAGACSP